MHVPDTATNLGRVDTDMADDGARALHAAEAPLAKLLQVSLLHLACAQTEPFAFTWCPWYPGYLDAAAQDSSDVLQALVVVQTISRPDSNFGIHGTHKITDTRNLKASFFCSSIFRRADHFMS